MDFADHFSTFLRYPFFFPPPPLLGQATSYSDDAHSNADQKDQLSDSRTSAGKLDNDHDLAYMLILHIINVFAGTPRADAARLTTLLLSLLISHVTAISYWRTTLSCAGNTLVGSWP